MHADIKLPGPNLSKVIGLFLVAHTATMSPSLGDASSAVRKEICHMSDYASVNMLKVLPLLHIQHKSR